MSTDVKAVTGLLLLIPKVTLTFRAAKTGSSTVITSGADISSAESFLEEEKLLTASRDTIRPSCIFAT